MRDTTIIKLKNSAIADINVIFEQANLTRMTNIEIIKYYEAVLFRVIKLPRYERSFIRGYIHCKNNLIWKEVEFCYDIDGILYSTWKESDKPKLRDLQNQNMKGFACAHYWKGTNKNYTTISIA